VEADSQRCVPSIPGWQGHRKHWSARRCSWLTAVFRITEAELARDTHAVLAKVREGVEVIVEQDHRPVAVIKTPQGPGRKISECIALAKAHEEELGYAPVPDPDFAKDVQAAIDAHCEPLNPPVWD
jgi:antitoxin (DNA-binding transcriptional repressor) of toxin-antitoxin stability system